MERIRVTLGKHSRTIGVSEPGALLLIVSAVSREAKTPGPRNECRLELGGLDSSTGTHLDWAKHDLSVGDKIEIEILDEGHSDTPLDERRLDPQVEDKQKKDYVRKLAAEFGWQIIEDA